MSSCGPLQYLTAMKRQWQVTVLKGSKVADFLADTWWFGLSQRLSEQGFKEIATLRATQGFSAIQLVVGVPPEVGPRNENAKSQVGFPWTVGGKFNPDYLALARERIEYLNGLGLSVIVYGAWGHQVEWLGREGMTQWWLKIIDSLDSLNVVYCLCGESNLWVGEASKLLPDKTSGDLVTSQLLSALDPRLKRCLVQTGRPLKKRLNKHRLDRRRSDWSSILERISQETNKPIIVHTIPGETGYKAVSNPHLLAANTIQTGHDVNARNRLWQLPLVLLNDDPAHKGLVNLEPWYEGIKDQFWAADQMFSYWASMLAGVTGYCYGAHGIWNVGDGRFLAHWGKQTFTQALALDTPRLLGLSHRQYLLHSNYEGQTFYQTSGNRLITIGKRAKGRTTQFFPDIARATQVTDGRIWLPLKGTFADTLPQTGQVVIFD
ncbi:MAG: DUF4038 domain-containing protein [Chloroflexota bacterium]|nr:DUF4038 domain-containing protein [Chloroflexota bacterium]